MIFSNFIPGSKLDPADESPTGDALSALSYFGTESTYDRLRRLVGVSSGKVVVCNKKQPSEILITATAIATGSESVDIRANNIINTNSNNSRLKKHGLAYRNNKSRLYNNLNHNFFLQQQQAANRLRRLENDNDDDNNNDNDNENENISDDNEDLNEEKLAVEKQQRETEQLLSSASIADVSIESTNSIKKPQSKSPTSTNSTSTITSTRGEKSTNDKRSPTNNNCWQLQCKYTRSEVQCHATLDDCWMVIFDKVYNITEFVYEHPGGDFILFEYAGRDATHPFLSTRHGSSAYKMLDKYWIGILVDEELYYSNNSSYCSVYSNLSWRQDSVNGADNDLTPSSPSSASSISATSSISSITTTTTSSTESTTNNDPITTTTTTTTNNQPES